GIERSGNAPPRPWDQRHATVRAGAHPRGGPVRRMIVDDDDLQIDIVLQQAVERLAHIALGIAHGHENGGNGHGAIVFARLPRLAGSPSRQRASTAQSIPTANRRNRAPARWGPPHDVIPPSSVQSAALYAITTGPQ